MQSAFVNVCCQVALPLQAGFICLKPPEMPHLHHLQQSWERKRSLKIQLVNTEQHDLHRFSQHFFWNMSNQVKCGALTSVMFTTNRRLGGSLSGSIVPLTTPTGQTDWFSKSTFTLDRNNRERERDTNVMCTFAFAALMLWTWCQPGFDVECHIILMALQ